MKAAMRSSSIRCCTALLLFPAAAVHAGFGPAGETSARSGEKAALATGSPGEASDATAALDGLIAEALARSPTLAALEARIGAAAESVRPAGALPNPVVGGMLQLEDFPSWNIGEMPMSMIGIEVRQGLMFPGKRDARRAVARADLRSRREELGAARRALVAAVREAYARIYALDRERALVGAAGDMIELLSTTVAMRYSTGDAELEAMVKVELEKSRLGVRLVDLAAERAMAVATLNRLLDRPASSALPEVTGIPELATPEPPWIDASVASSADVAIARAAADSALRRGEVERLEQKPNLEAASGIATRGALGPVFTLGLGLELPLWQGTNQEPRLRAAILESKVAAHELRAVEAEARAEASMLATEWQRAEAQLERYREAIVPQSSLAFEGARAAYASGRGDFSTVVEDFGLWLEARVEVARYEARRLAISARILALVADASPAEAANLAHAKGESR